MSGSTMQFTLNMFTNERVTIHAFVPERYTFVRWESENNGIVFDTPQNQTTSFRMTDSNAVIKAVLDIAYILGNVTGSGVLGPPDLVRLARFLAGHDVTIIPEAARVTAQSIADGTIGPADLVRLARFLAGHSVVLGS